MVPLEQQLGNLAQHLQQLEMKQLFHLQVFLLQQFQSPSLLGAVALGDCTCQLDHHLYEPSSRIL